MEIKSFKKYGIVLIEDTYTDEELKKIWQDIEKLEKDNLFLEPKNTGSAKDYYNGDPFKKNKGVFLNKHFHSNKIKNILPISDKLINHSGIKNNVSICSTFHKIYNYINHTSSLLSYYENEGHYLPHTDFGIFTIITWLFRQPKSFDDGVFSFPDLKLEIEPNYNRTVIFPSSEVHAVSNVKIKTNEPGFGRFALSHFCFIIPQK